MLVADTVEQRKAIVCRKESECVSTSLTCFLWRSFASLSACTSTVSSVRTARCIEIVEHGREDAGWALAKRVCTEEDAKEQQEHKDETKVEGRGWSEAAFKAAFKT